MIDANIKISAIEYCLGEKRENGLSLQKDNPDWRIEDIESKTGIKTRWIALKGTTAVDLACKACDKIFEKIDRNKVDTLLFVTQSPDYFLPSSSCIIQNRVSLKTTTKCFDINLGCSGFVYALSMAAAYIKSGFSDNVLIVCADTYSKYIDKNDRTNRPIFSDAGSAILITESDSKKVGPFEFGTDGSNYDKLIVKEGAAKSCFIKNTNPTLHMDGAAVFMFTMSVVSKSISSFLNSQGVIKEKINMYIFHQASKVVLDNLQRVLKIPDDKMYKDIEGLGNTVSSSIPIALKDADINSLISHEELVLISGFGVGLSWGTCLITWNKLL
ncbi:ketoacyl-ACP synthase III [Candidatus Thioglobus sp.]|nr:ketoacyl-ACP synthase III [Candidatus Thioglobus sp.]